MSKYKKNIKAIGGIFLVCLVCFLAFRQIHNFREKIPQNFLEILATEVIMTGPTNDWLYFSSLANGDLEESGLWRIHKETGEKEHIFEKLVDGILVLGDKIYARTFDGLYQMDPDGGNVELLIEGMGDFTKKICYQNGRIYFMLEEYFCRYHIRTGELYRLCKQPAGAHNFGVPLVVGGDYLYSTGIEEGKQGIWQYSLKNGKSEVCTNLNTGMKTSGYEDGQRINLTECGDYLVLIYYGRPEEKRIEKIYATRKGERITEKTVWKEVHFPDMQKGSALPPHDTVSIHMGNLISEAGTKGYVFHDGYAYYLNQDWNLCARPLFGRKNEVTVYEGTSIWVDPNERISYWKNNLVFGRDCFYYRYYTEVDEESIKGEGIVYEPVPTEWSDYIGEVPE